MPAPVANPLLIPGYRIEERLGSGSAGAVYRAERLTDGKEVALKVVNLSDIEAEFEPAERFKREARLLGRIHHPSLPRIHDFGVTNGELGFLVLELVRGLSIGSYADRPVVDLIPSFVLLAEAMRAVALEGIVHRDLSPDNILVEDQGERLFPRIIDFGIAKDLLAARGLTRSGTFLGKLSYASPEQLTGLPAGQKIDFRSDVYSLGMVMYEVAAGRPAIPATGLIPCMEAHRAGKFDPLRVTPARGGPAPVLEALVARMTQARRDLRPRSWDLVLSDLWRALDELSPEVEKLVAERLKVVSQIERAARPRSERPAPEVPRLGRPPDEDSRIRIDMVRSAVEEAIPDVAQHARTGRLVLGAGVGAVGAAVLFAAWYVLKDPAALVIDAGTAKTPAGAASSPGVPKRESPANPTAPPEDSRPISAAAPSLTAAAPEPTAVPSPPPQPPLTFKKGEGGLLLSGGAAVRLVELRSLATRRVVARDRSLPAVLRVTAGSYRAVLASGPCRHEVTVRVPAGRSLTVTSGCD